MILVISAVLLNCIELITSLTEPMSNNNWADYDDTIIPNKIKYASKTSKEELLAEEVTSYFDSRELFHYTPVTYPVAYTKQPLRERTIRLAAEGAFFNFTVDLYESILSKFQSRYIKRYFKILGSKLRGSTSRRRSCRSFLRHFVNYLARKAKILSRKRVSKIKERVRGILNDTLEQKPKRVAFFKAMNSLYTFNYELKLDAYIYYLRGYGRGLETDRLMKRQTGILFQNVIFHLLDKQEDNVRDEVIMKLMLAYEEYYS